MFQSLNRILGSILVWGALLSHSYGSELTDRAYRAYREGKYTLAFQLYRKSADRGEIKGIYNLALFYDRGLGTRKDPLMALKGYRRVAKGIRERIEKGTVCEDPMLPYYLKSVGRLEKAGEDTGELVSGLYGVCGEAMVKFMRECPEVSVISPKYWRYMYEFPCDYYRKFPRSMRSFLALERRYSDAVRRGETDEMKRIRKRVVEVVRPMLAEALREEIECVRRARVRGDLMKCEMGYVSRCDSLLFSDRYSAYADAIHFGPPEELRREETERRQPVEKSERDEMIRELKKRLRKGDLYP